jgi:4-alpha-glucanotransferase
MNRVSLVLILHAHQPIGNFDSVLEQNYRLSYLPFIECLERHPAVAVSLHYSGVLLEWLDLNHLEYIERLRALREAGSIEFLAGGFFEPILISIPDRDRQAQIGLLRDYIERRFGERPRGLWLTERVWEPTLPESLARAGIEYTLVDDLHFLSAGIEPDALYGYYRTESLGHWVGMIPGLQSLRYTMPWKPVGETIRLLQEAAEQHPDSMVAVGDDLEKFGGWPATYRSVYEERWLDEFFSAVEANGSWLSCCRASDYLDSHDPLGTAYLPTASYREMTEWALSGPAANLYHQALERVPSLERGMDFLRFVSGGTWPAFFAKYSESNLLHKQMLALSERFQKARPQGSDSSAARAWEAAYRHLLAAQCNDAYWHGVFGGLYSPHLRHGLYSRLIQAEAGLEALQKPFSKRRVLSERKAWFGQRREALEIRSAQASCLLQPSDGATVTAIRSKVAAANLVNALRRRPESYHAKVRSGVQSAGGFESIHDRVVSKEQGLDRLLLYDRYDRHAFRLYLFPESKAWDDFAALRLEESSEWAAGKYDVESEKENGAVFARTGSLSIEGADLEIEVQKEFALIPKSDSAELRCSVRIDCMQGHGRFRLGLETILNLLAGNAPDRRYIADGWSENLNWGGEKKDVRGSLKLQDEWLRLDLDLCPSPAPERWWLAPIFTVSQSEEGFEKVYQGSAILPVWDVELKTADSWEGSITLAIRTLV